jgi:hypothetical protein
MTKLIGLAAMALLLVAAGANAKPRIAGPYVDQEVRSNQSNQSVWGTHPF